MPYVSNLLFHELLSEVLQGPLHVTLGIPATYSHIAGILQEHNFMHLVAIDGFCRNGKLPHAGDLMIPTAACMLKCPVWSSMQAAVLSF